MEEIPTLPAYVRLSSLPYDLVVSQHLEYGSMSRKWYLRIILKARPYAQVSVYEDGGIYGIDDSLILSRNCPGATNEEKFGNALRYVESLVLLGEL